MTDLAPLRPEGDPLARPTNQEDTVQPYTDADVLDLQDVIADARIRGIGNGTYSMARAILEAGYRPTPTRTADHPHTDPGDGRTECERCGKYVWPVIHSCKGVPVTPAARQRWEARGTAPRD